MCAKLQKMYERLVSTKKKLNVFRTNCPNMTKHFFTHLNSRHCAGKLRDSGYTRMTVQTLALRLDWPETLMAQGWGILQVVLSRG